MNMFKVEKLCNDSQVHPATISIASLIMAFFWPRGDSRRKEGNAVKREGEGIFAARNLAAVVSATEDGVTSSHPFILRFWTGQVRPIGLQSISVAVTPFGKKSQ